MASALVREGGGYESVGLIEIGVPEVIDMVVFLFVLFMCTAMSKVGSLSAICTKLYVNKVGWWAGTRILPRQCSTAPIAAQNGEDRDRKMKTRIARYM